MSGLTSKRGALIIEDNELNREMLAGILEDDYRVFQAVDGQDGLEKLRQHFRELSVILLDVQMPRMNGYEFLEQYRLDPLLASVPVIVTTGSNISEDEERCLALGASDFVTKPYNPVIILRRIEAVIRLCESAATLQAVEFEPVTGFYTANAFRHHARNIVSAEPEGHFDLILMRLENLAYLRERYGTTAVNSLLTHFGTFIRANSDHTQIVSRYSEDRLLLLCRHEDGDICGALRQCRDLMRQSAPIPNYSVKLAIYSAIPAEEPMESLYQHLLLALQSITGQHDKDIVFYDARMSESNDRLHKIEECMEQALTEKQFMVYYQPKHDATSRRLVGAEALIRWIHPEYGFMSPGDFIPLFEQNGFITQVDLYIWKKVCEDLRRWEDLGLPTVPISVNASRRDFIHLDSADAVIAPVLEFHVNQELLHIEITESLSIANEAVTQKVKAIRDLGFKIELDDFGSGQSSLGTLKDIPMDIIKLDMSFVRSLDKQKEVVEMIIALSHALGHKIVAEGVETDEQLATLRELGCDYIQGYYFSKPLPEADFRKYLKKEQQEGEAI